jgi:glycosyltransferase involved in cell wall biosynthesis
MSASVSVVIPAYNAAAFLKDALDSALRQSFPPLEILVVDDGSTDQTGQIAASVPGVHCFFQANAGVSAARNRGIREAKGQFVALLDADDVWEINKLAVQVDGLRDNQFAYSARSETNERLEPVRVVQSDRRVSLLEALLFRGNVVGTPSSVIAPRKALLEAGGFDSNLSMCADWDMWIRLALRLSSQYSERPLVQYRVRGDSMSTDLGTYESDSVYMLKKAFGMDLPAALMARRREAESRMWEVLAGGYWNQGAFGDAFRCTVKSIGRRPSRLAALAVSVPYRMARRALGSAR